ncbi:MAG TPA: hypothetical protein QGG59_04145 [Planctomycetota bacterium]|nr:hypothetical protein [Planctomycetota bacterium]HJM39290.1 hypothetical protein [Planctomycetota bacterium]
MRNNTLALLVPALALGACAQPAATADATVSATPSTSAAAPAEKSQSVVIAVTGMR